MKKKLLFLAVITIFFGGKIFTQSNTFQQNRNQLVTETDPVLEEKVRLIITEGLNNPNIITEIENNTTQFFSIMENAIVESNTPDLEYLKISSEAVRTLLAMWKTSAIAPPVKDVERKCLVRPQGGYQIRDIPIIMLEAPEKDKNQSLVINFTSEGVIDDIFIAVHGIVDFYEQNENVKDFIRKQRILDLVERFRTAYNMKDVDFLEKIFSNNALIITGKVIKEKPNSDQVLTNNLTTERIEYITQTKEQYLKKLRLIFNMIKYINVVFEDIEVSKHTKFPEIYGVNLKQKWNASNYSDEGFLFLMIDFKDDNEPLVQIRAWQPLTFNGRALKPEEKFRTTSFGEIRGR